MFDRSYDHSSKSSLHVGGKFAFFVLLLYIFEFVETAKV